MERTGSQSSRYLEVGRALWPWLVCADLSEEERDLPCTLKIGGQKGRIGHVVGIAGGRNSVSRGERVGQCYGDASLAGKRIEYGV